MKSFLQSTSFQKWVGRLKDERAKALIAARLNRLAAGNAGDVEPVGAGISELRIHYGPGYRIYFIDAGAVVILLLCGGDKSTQQRDIRRAKEIALEWRTENG